MFGRGNEHGDWHICLNLARCLNKQAQILYKTEAPGLGFLNRGHGPDLRLCEPGVFYFMGHGRLDNCSTFIHPRPSLSPIPSQIPIVAASISSLSDEDKRTVIRLGCCPGSTQKNGPHSSPRTVSKISSLARHLSHYPTSLIWPLPSIGARYQMRWHIELFFKWINQYLQRKNSQSRQKMPRKYKPGPQSRSTSLCLSSRSGPPLSLTQKTTTDLLSEHPFKTQPFWTEIPGVRISCSTTNWIYLIFNKNLVILIAIRNFFDNAFGDWIILFLSKAVLNCQDCTGQ